MGFTAKLADLFVQFSATGVDVLKNALEGVKEQLAGVKKAAEIASRGAMSEFKQLKTSLAEIDIKASPKMGLEQVKAAETLLAGLREKLAAKTNKLTIRLGAEGLERVQSDLAGIEAKLTTLRKSAEGQIVGEGLSKVFKDLTKYAKTAFDEINGRLLSFVSAGLAGTNMGERLTLQFGMLSREIAQLFLPQIEAVSAQIQRLVEWFRSLSGEQQEQIGRWALWTAGILGVVAALPRVVAAVTALVTVIRGLAVGLAIVSGLTLNAAGIALALGAAAATAGAIYAATRGSGDAGGTQGGTQAPKGRNELTLARTGFEGVADSFRRIQQAALRQDLANEIPKQQLEKLGFIDEKLGFIVTGVRLKKPVFTD